MSEIPVFNLNNDLDFDELNKMAEEEEKKGGKFLDVGLHDVTIKSVEYNRGKDGNASIFMADPSWIKVKVVLAQGEREFVEYLSVPTQTPMYTKPGGKPTLFLYRNLKRFLEGLGETVDAKNVLILCQKFFSPDSLNTLVGSPMRIEIGHTKTYFSKWVEKDKYVLAETATGEAYLDSDGKEVEGISKDAVVLAAASLGIKDTNISNFPEIVKYHKSTLAVKKEAEAEKSFKEEDGGWDD